MPDRLDVAVVGAGPFGLSVAALLADRRTRVYGEHLRTWRTLMPPDMLLRSAWEETSLAAPRDAGSIDAWSAAAQRPREEPIPLHTFLRYAEWFADRFVPDRDPSDVASVEALPGGGFRVVAGSGSEAEAGAVVVAVGVTPFAHAPAPFRAALGEGVGFAIRQADHSRFAGRRVVVVGAGQAGLETAALAARAGGDVEVLARSGVRWFADREPHYERGPIRSLLYRLAYPAVGYGPPPLNRLVLHPDLFAALPRGARERLTRRLLRPGGSPWIRSQVDDLVRISAGVTVAALERGDGRLRLRLSDGSEREADDVLLATGYRFALDRLGFLAPELRARVELDHGWPRLDAGFRSSVPGLLFVGYPAEGRFGPLSRFVLGTRFTASRVRRSLVG